MGRKINFYCNISGGEKKSGSGKIIINAFPGNKTHISPWFFFFVFSSMFEFFSPAPLPPLLRSRIEMEFNRYFYTFVERVSDRYLLSSTSFPFFARKTHPIRSRFFVLFVSKSQVTKLKVEKSSTNF